MMNPVARPVATTAAAASLQVHRHGQGDNLASDCLLIANFSASVRELCAGSQLHAATSKAPNLSSVPAQFLGASVS